MQGRDRLLYLQLRMPQIAVCTHSNTMQHFTFCTCDCVMQCMDGFQFQLPVSGHQNWILVQAAAGLKVKGTFVWVHYKVNGTDVYVDSAY